MGTVRSSLGVFALVVAASASCKTININGRDTGDAGAVAPTGPTATALISAASGGSVRLPDGTQLEVPPGALATDTSITMTRGAPAAYGPGGVLASVNITPDGLVFSQPATLTLPFDPAGVPAGDDVQLTVTSSANTPRDVGGERSVMEVVAGATKSADRFVAAILHLSAYHVFYAPQMFVVPEIPGEYLRSGDVLFSLTGGDAHSDAWMLPMHVGLFEKNALNDAVVESTIPTGGCPPQDGVTTGVYNGDCGFRILKGQHIFLGARRPSSSVTVEQGKAAVVAARSYLGVSYGAIGLPSSSVATGLGMSCVQLTEQSWETAGANISLVPDVLLTPSNQYGSTVPVKRIAVKANRTVRIPVIVAAKISNLTLSYTAAGGNRLAANVTLTVNNPGSTKPERVSLQEPQATPGAGKFGIQAVKDIVFTPADDDVGFSYGLDLHVEVPSLGFVRDVKDFLTIEVEGSTPCGPEVIEALGKTGAKGKLSGAADGVGTESYDDVAMVVKSDGTISIGGPPIPAGGFHVSAKPSATRPIVIAPSASQTFNVNKSAVGPVTGNLAFTSVYWRCKPAGKDVVLLVPASDGGQVVLSFSEDCRKVDLAIDVAYIGLEGSTEYRCSYKGSFSGTVP